MNVRKQLIQAGLLLLMLCSAQLSTAQIRTVNGKILWSRLSMVQSFPIPAIGNNGNRFNSNFEFYKDQDMGYVFFMNCRQEPTFTKLFNQFLKNGN